MQTTSYSSARPARVLLAACLALAASVATAAAPTADAALPAPRDGAPFLATSLATFHTAPPPGPGLGAPLPPFLRGIELSEAQQDALFELMNKQAPAFYEKEKQLRHAREDLTTLGTAAQFDDARAKTLADTLGRVTGELALLRARTDQRVMQLLTPEQRQQLGKAKRPPVREPFDARERMPREMPHDMSHDMPPR